MMLPKTSFRAPLEGELSKITVTATQGAHSSARAPCRSEGAEQRVNGEIPGCVVLLFFVFVFNVGRVERPWCVSGLGRKKFFFAPQVKSS
jgi:hypothetical protein